MYFVRMKLFFKFTYLLTVLIQKIVNSQTHNNFGIITTIIITKPHILQKNSC